MTDPPLTNAHRQRAIETAHKLLAALPDRNLRAAFIFGSVAWGDADAASDLDLMLLLDLPLSSRQVTRIRVADLVCPVESGTLRFADLDRIPWSQFEQATRAGRWAQRVVNAIILLDESGDFKRLQERVVAEYSSPSAMEERWLRHRQEVTEHLSEARATMTQQPELAALNDRLAVKAAVTALLEAQGNRFSPTHYVGSIERALERTGNRRRMPQFLHVMALDEDPEDSVERGMRAYRTIAAALSRWVREPALRAAMSIEDVAWAEFIDCAETYEEIDHKLTCMRQARSGPTMVAYVDGLLETPIRMSTSKVLNLRAGNSTQIMTEPDFHMALAEVPELQQSWVMGLRLRQRADQTENASNLAHELLLLSRPAS